MSLTSNTLSRSNNVNKESNKRRKGAGAVSKKYNKKNLQNPIQNQVRQMNFLPQMVNISCFNMSNLSFSDLSLLATQGACIFSTNLVSNLTNEPKVFAF